MAESKGEKYCPSAPAERGAVLLGVVNERGTVDILAERLEVSDGFLHQAEKGRSPLRRFRFSSPCQGKRCKQWKGARCSVADLVQDHFAEKSPMNKGRLAECAIRDACRWVHQNGLDACMACRFVVTDNRPSLK